MLPQNILKSRCSEKQFPTFWTSNRVVFMKSFVAMRRLFSVKNRGYFAIYVSHWERDQWRQESAVRQSIRFFSPYPRRQGCLTICRCETKAAHSTQLVLRPWLLVRPAIEPGPISPKSGTQPIEPTSRRFWRTLPLHWCHGLSGVGWVIKGLMLIGTQSCFRDPLTVLIYWGERIK